LPPLPIDPLLPRIVEALQRSPSLVIEAPPGAGKTTRVPPALLRFPGNVLVLEPRRIAARMAARRVAAELGEKPGDTVGYQVRFEKVAGPRTRLRFLTEGVLARQLLANPRLDGVGVVVLDEFHERHLDTDFALALLRHLQQTARPDLRLVVMSATLDTASLAEFLDCPAIRSAGHLFDVAIEHLPYSAAPLEEQVAGAVERLVRDPRGGDILVFLPGAAEIRRAIRACQNTARVRDLLLLPLHGDLSAAEQDRAVTPSGRRKAIFSTNVAESSITVEGVGAVVDSGLARVAADSPWSGLPVLRIARVSKASAAQRAGRAGRTGPGRVIRLYSADDFARRPDRHPPEIARRELSQLCLDLYAMGFPRISSLPWLEQPPAAAIQTAEALLERLGAIQHGAVTPLGRRMAGLPLHPRLARLALEGASRGVAGEACRAAALLSVGVRADDPNLLHVLDSVKDPTVERTYHQIRREIGDTPNSTHQPSGDALPVTILSAFPDRVARRRAGTQLLLASGGSAELLGETGTEFLVALDIEERPERGLPLVRLFSPMRSGWLVDLFPHLVRERNAAEWNRAAERVEAVSALLYDELVIEETRGGLPEPEVAAELLAARALEAGLERFVDAGELSAFFARVSFAAQHGAVRPLADVDVHAALRDLCRGLRSFAELKTIAAPGLIPALEKLAGARLLNEIAPLRIRLPGGRTVRVHYAAGQPPWIESRLQDFFGMRETPRIANGRVPLVIHLLAPNHRPVQTTTDLSGFWERLYPQVRKDLSRRYPKHAWPEKP
jgi:ATP-dependent helicase HrpB